MGWGGSVHRETAGEGSTTSQQLAILRMKTLVETREAGNSTCYRLRDPHVNELLDFARRIFESHVIALRSMTAEPGMEEAPRDEACESKGTA